MSTKRVAVTCVSEYKSRPVATKPTFEQLINLNGVSVVDHITSHTLYQCVDFAHVLLKNDALVRKYQIKAKDDIDEFVHLVLGKWVAQETSTLEGLVQCVRTAGLDGTLAKAIKDACSGGLKVISYSPIEWTLVCSLEVYCYHMNEACTISDPRHHMYDKFQLLKPARYFFALPFNFQPFSTDKSNS